MARGRSLVAFEKLYIDGFDMSGYTIDPGERGAEYETGEALCIGDAIKGVINGQPTFSFGPVNGVFDNTATSGIHVLANAAQGTRRYIMHARGVRTVPAIGDDAFCAIMYQQSYKGGQTDSTVTATMTFSHDSTSGLNYRQPFGVLLHPWGSETGANTANTNADNGAASALGWWFMYQIYSITGAGTVTVSVDESSTGSSGWAALTGATSGAIATASAPIAGFVQGATNAAVKQYLRFQVAFGGSATACTFVSALMRG
jgi:hypothetical protein